LGKLNEAFRCDTRIDLESVKYTASWELGIQLEADHCNELANGHGIELNPGVTSWVDTVKAYRLIGGDVNPDVRQAFETGERLIGMATRCDGDYGYTFHQLYEIAREGYSCFEGCNFGMPNYHVLLCVAVLNETARRILKQLGVSDD